MWFILVIQNSGSPKGNEMRWEEKHYSGSKVPKTSGWNMKLETWKMRSTVQLFCLLNDKHVIFTDLPALEPTWKSI